MIGAYFTRRHSLETFPVLGLCRRSWFTSLLFALLTC
jgi:hypothetical protein